MRGGPLIFFWCSMRSLPAFLALMFVLAASAASADSRVFIVANQADGYGVDQCLAMGEKCGAHAARSYCQSRDFAQALSYRRVDRVNSRYCGSKLQPCRLQRLRGHYLSALSATPGGQIESRLCHTGAPETT